MKNVKQFDRKDCGLYIIKYFVKHFYKREVDLDLLKLEASYGNDGINIYSLKTLAKNYSLNIDAYNCELDSLNDLSKKEFPIVLLINKNGMNHFVILIKIKKNNFFIYDPEDISIHVYNYLELNEVFQKTILCFYSQFWNSDKNTNISNQISSLINNKKYSFALLLLAMINLFCIIGVSFYTKIIFDIILPNNSKINLLAIFILFLFLNLFRHTTSIIKNLIVNKLSIEISYNLTSSLVNKLENLKLNNFYKLEILDYLRRFNYIEVIANFKSLFLFNFIFDSMSIIISSLVLMYINFFVFSIVISILLFLYFLNYLYQQKIQKLTTNLIKQKFIDYQCQKNFLENCSNFNKQDLSHFLKTKMFINKIKLWKNENQINNISNSKNFLNEWILSNLSLIVIFISSWFLLNNKGSLGNIVMFLSLINFLINPFNSLNNLFVSKNLYNEAFVALNFVLNLEIKDSLGFISIPNIQKINIKKLVYAYEDGKNIIDIENFVIDSHLQIRGKNGSGKTTFLNIIKNNLENWNGYMEINNINYLEIDKNEFNSNFIFINNNNIIPQIKLSEYLSSGNRNKFEELNNILNFGELPKLINKMKINLNMMLKENASNLSAGQRQFISLLKLFTKKYKLIILDEAFENLDNDIKKDLKIMIKDYQCDALFIEVSHTNNFIFTNKEINFGEINKIK
ncbi:Mbov_0121 family peptidase domain-containing ABC transporter [Mycoplasma sp. 1018B]|uniref:Mbov_0121 family peptidase domain-containing ABC transporter n=1 Tax=Mycoplasma sp. 1018B TaxID=2967302 RepID=UPI00211C786F|nr:cysteine peptidase family C39 domain-containing protein [Mycoplasma sp. 1018B]UUM19229.1 cysteine peptidase family C39 domain-containing protein [Mycoplasma sp. 1018B]